MQYKMVLQTATGHLGWEYCFDIASDRMAITYAASHAKSFASCSWVHSILVFNIDPREPCEALLASIKLSQPEPIIEYKEMADAIRP